MNPKGGLTIAMKTFSILAAVIATALVVSCQKQQTDEERNAEIDRKVQERLAAEHQAQQQKELEQRQADLDAREKALAEKENATPPTQNRREQAESGPVESRPRAREPRERAISVGYSTFYNKLDPYGDWIETGDYGYVFHPRQAEGSRWRPYTDGRWVYTDAGWTWISEEPFGWATYHYGRWTRLRGIGWVWVPGNQWAPAWVSWRKSSDYVGWAPLPPEARFDQRTGIHNWSDSYYDVGPDQYCFVASREFGAPRVHQTLLPPERSVTIINQTTNVTNITYNNTTIVNEGPSYDELRSISREPVQRYRLERNVSVDLAVGAPPPEVRGETVVVAAPVIAAPVANERPLTVKQTIAAAAVVDLGWAAISNQEEAKKTRQKMKSEATPPPNAPSKKYVNAEAAMTSTTTQVAESPATSTSATVASTAAATTTPAATTAASATPASTPPPPRRAATVAPTATAASTPISSPAVSPAASQRRGRLLVPNARPTPRVSASVPRSAPIATPPTTASNSPTTSESVPSRETTPSEASPLMPAQSLPAETRGKFKSQTPQFQPRKVEPMQSASPSPSAASTSSPNAAVAPSITPGEKLTKQEKKEQKREEKREMKRERKEGNAPVSPSPTP